MAVVDCTDIVRTVSRSFGDTAKIFIVDADYLDFINAGQLKIARETECLTTTVTPAATSFPYALPTDFLKVKRVVYGQIPLPYVDIEDLDAKGQSLTDRNTPQFYFFYDEKISLFPLQQTTDSTVVTIAYATIPAEVTSIADPITIPQRYTEDLHNFCLARAHERNENYRAQENVEAKLENSLAKGREDQYEQDDTYPVVRDDPLDNWMW